MSKTVLKGMAWAHTRALAPLQVTSRVYTDFHPDVSIEWDVRSLHHFGEGALEELAKQYDFILLDYPFMGAVANGGLLLPLDEELDATFLEKLAAQSVGQSFNSYNYNGHQWALPIDAAAQVACSRKDLLTNAGYEVPTTWNEVMTLAKETGKVAMPMAAMGALGGFFTLCANQGHPAFSTEGKAVDETFGEHVLMQLKSLYDLNPSWCTGAYPPAIFNKMATDGEIWYVPISYGYVNYSMNGYAPNILHFHNIPAAGNEGPKGATLGGVGMAISANTSHKEVALDYAAWVTGAACQKTVYSYSGGQAANSDAWDDDTVNNLTHNFYRNTRETLEQSFVRPRYEGYHHFQSFAGKLLQAFLKEGLKPASVMKEMNRQYAKSRMETPVHT